MTDLIPLENVNAVELFSDEKTIQALLDRIEHEATDFNPDVTTEEGRAEIRSRAYKVSKSKTVIDNAGKELTAEWVKRKKIVDTGRKVARDFCDELRDRIRQPLTDYEAEEARKEAEAAEAAAHKAVLEAAWVEAHAEDNIWEREQKIKAYEERIAREEAERKRIRDEQAAAEAREKEAERVRLEAEETARREAQDAIDEAERKAKEAERQRIESEERAEREKQEAIDREKRLAKEEAERKERERIRLEEAEKREAQARAADRENRRKINGAIVDAFMANGVGERTAKKIVTLVAGGKVPNISIRY